MEVAATAAAARDRTVLMIIRPSSPKMLDSKFKGEYHCWGRNHYQVCDFRQWRAGVMYEPL